MSFFSINKQYSPSAGRLHVAAQRRDSAPLRRFAVAYVGTSLCQGVIDS